MSIISEIVKSTPVAGQAYGFLEVAKNVTLATVIGVSTIIQECSPPVIRYPIASSSNPVTGAFAWSMVIGSAKQILMQKML